MIHRHRFAGSQVLRVHIAPQGKLGVPFLNWRISAAMPARSTHADPRLAGSGLYGVCFRGQLIHIGSYCGCVPAGHAQGAYFTGDVARARWRQHLGSLTARSDKLHVSRSVLSTLRQAQADCDIVTGLTQAGPAIHKDEGCLATEGRLRFAMRNWDWFKHASPLRLLGQFSFLYAREDGTRLTGTAEDLDRCIRAAEAAAITLLRPELHAGCHASPPRAARLDARRALVHLATILDDHLRPLRPSAPHGRRPWQPDAQASARAHGGADVPAA